MSYFQTMAAEHTMRANLEC